MSLVSDAGGLLVAGVGVGVVNKSLGHTVKASKKWKKGWHGESLRHSEARRKHLWMAGNNSGYSLFKTKKQAVAFKKKVKMKSVKVSKVIP